VKSFPRACSVAALVAITFVAGAGLVAGGIRLLPWLLDPAVSWRIAAPFARGLAAVAVESAILVGWPLGWALACASFVERGHARVLQTLGERPLATAGRLAAHGAGFAITLATVAGIYGRDAGAPGAVATELVAHARAACAAVRVPSTYSIPFTSFTWLCVPGRTPRITGSLAGFLASSSIVSAEDARIAGDFRALTLTDARVLIQGAGGPAAAPTTAAPLTPPLSVSMHVGRLTLRGMSPWAQASILPAAIRALVLTVSGWITAMAAAWSVLRSGVRSRMAAVTLGAAGPVAALALMRLLERMSARPLAFAAVPVACAMCTLGLGWFLGWLIGGPVSPMGLKERLARWKLLGRRRHGPLRTPGRTASH
jgi:hypothetical protein